MSNPINDFSECVHSARTKIKLYFDLFEKRSTQYINGPWYKRIFKKKRLPQPKVIQDADRSIIMVYWWDEQLGIVAPPMKISYKRDSNGNIINTYKLDTKPFIKGATDENSSSEIQ